MQIKPKVTLLAHTPEPDKVIAAAAKLCYSKSPASQIMDNLTEESTASFLDMLMGLGHASPIEHATFTFGIEGVSRSLTHQLVRHRLASYSQKSQRYVTEGAFDYVLPPEIEEIPEAKAEFIQAMENAQKAYDNLSETLTKKHYDEFIKEGKSEKEAKRLAEKKAIEDARFVLPNACETMIVATMNVRELLHFFNQRCCNRAQWEIRDLAKEMLRQCYQVAPKLFENAGPPCINGPCPEGNMTCGLRDQVRAEFEEIKK